MDAAQSVADCSDAEYIGRSVAVKDHVATDEDQLNVRAGEVVYVIEQDETGWWGGHKEGEEGTGWFPGTILRCPLEPVGPGAGLAASPGPDASPAASPVARQGPAAEDSRGAARAEADSSPAACRSPPPATCEPGCMWDNRMVASPQRKEESRALAGGVAAEDAGSMAAYGGPPAYSFGPPCVAPTPPRGDSAAEQGAAAVAAVLAGDADACLADVRAERDRLQADVGALHGELHQLRRQCVADQGRIRELDQLLKSQERQLKDHASTQDSLSTEVAVLREKLEGEVGNSKAQIMANDQMRQRYEEKLKEKAEDNRRDTDTARRSIQAEQQRARELEQQLREARGELDQLRRERDAASASANGAEAARAKAEQQAAQAEQRRARELEQQLREARGELDQLRRERDAASASARCAEAARAKDDGVGQQTSGASPGRRLWASPGPSRTAPAPAPESPSRGRPLPRPSDQQLTPPQPRPQSRPQSRPWLTRTPSAGGDPKEECELPQRGSVLEKVSIFEERCRSQTPVGRDASRARSRSVTGVGAQPQRSLPGVALAAVQRMRSSPERHARSAPLADGMTWGVAAPTAAYLPSRVVTAIADEETRPRGRQEPTRGAGGIVPPIAALGQEVSGDQSGDSQPFMGMSPIHQAADEAGAGGFSAGRAGPWRRA